MSAFLIIASTSARDTSEMVDSGCVPLPMRPGEFWFEPRAGGSRTCSEVITSASSDADIRPSPFLSMRLKAFRITIRRERNTIGALSVCLSGSQQFHVCVFQLPLAPFRLLDNTRHTVNRS